MKFARHLPLLLLPLLTGCGLFKPVTLNPDHPDRPRDRPATVGRPRTAPPTPPAPASAPETDRDASPTTFIRQDITDHAQELMGLKYKFGGNNPRQGFDCSGFVLYLYQHAGIDIERVSRDQAKQGKEVKPSRARPGDLVFFKRRGKPVHHVSVVVEPAAPGRLTVVHATNSGVIRENILASRYWEPMIYQVRDVLR